MTATTTDASMEELLGLAAYWAVAAQARLAKDADQAPKTFEHVEMARMSARAWKSFEHVENLAAEHGIDIIRAIGQHEGVLDELDARTRPTTWWERLTKTYVGIGIFTDAMREIATAIGEEELARQVGDYGHGQWVRERLEPYTQADEQLRARLSLWTRRVGGEALGLVRALMFTNPELVGEADTDAIMDALTRNHRERLAQLHLTA